MLEVRGAASKDSARVNFAAYAFAIAPVVGAAAGMAKARNARFAALVSRSEGPNAHGRPGTWAVNLAFPVSAILAGAPPFQRAPDAKRALHGF